MQRLAQEEKELKELHKTDDRDQEKQEKQIEEKQPKEKAEDEDQKQDQEKETEQEPVVDWKEAPWRRRREPLQLSSLKEELNWTGLLVRAQAETASASLYASPLYSFLTAKFDKEDLQQQIQPPVPPPPALFQAMILAIHSHNTVSIFSLLEDPDFTEVNWTDMSGKTALHLAIIWGLQDVSLAILARRDFKEVSRCDDDGWTALHYASAWGLEDVMEAILDHSDFTEANAVDRWQRTALHVAAGHGTLGTRARAVLQEHTAFTCENLLDKDGLSAADLLERALEARPEHDIGGLQILGGGQMPSFKSLKDAGAALQCGGPRK